MGKPKGMVDRRVIKCPVCKEKFLPAEMHVYKTTPFGRGKYICSYHCMLKYRRDKEANAKKRGRKAKCVS